MENYLLNVTFLCGIAAFHKSLNVQFIILNALMKTSPAWKLTQYIYTCNAGAS